MSNNLIDSPNLFHCLGIGIVAVDKQIDTHEIQVFVKSLFPLSDGEVAGTAEVETQTSDTVDGKKQTSKVMVGNTIPATWKCFDSNRITSPDVRVGSQVMIFQMSEEGQFFWTTWDIGPEKHRLEHVKYAFNASPNFTGNVPFDYKDYYVLEVSPLNGTISLDTSQANNEPAGFHLSFNTKDGLFTLVDSEGNMMHLDAMEYMWMMRNGKESLFVMNKKDINMTNKGNTTFNTAKTFTIDTDKFILNCNKAEIGAKEGTTINSPTTTHTGNVGVLGNLGVTGGFTCDEGEDGSGGTAVIGGSMEVKKKLTVVKDAIIGGISYLGHTHDTPEGTSGPPK